MKTKQKIYVVHIWGVSKDERNISCYLPYFFSSLQNAKKFVEKEEKENKNKDYGTWIQKEAKIMLESGQYFDDWRVK